MADDVLVVSDRLDQGYVKEFAARMGTLSEKGFTGTWTTRLALGHPASARYWGARARPHEGYRPMVSQAVLPTVTQTALGVAAMPQVTLVRSPSGMVRMIRSVRGSIFVTEFPVPPIPPVVQTAPAPTARTPGCSAERSRRWSTCSVCGSISNNPGPACPDAHGAAVRAHTAPSPTAIQAGPQLTPLSRRTFVTLLPPALIASTQLFPPEV